MKLTGMALDYFPASRSVIRAIKMQTEVNL